MAVTETGGKMKAVPYQNTVGNNYFIWYLGDSVIKRAKLIPVRGFIATLSLQQHYIRLTLVSKKTCLVRLSVQVMFVSFRLSR